MNRKTLISLAAAAALSIGFATAAKANPQFEFGIQIGQGQPSFNFGMADYGDARPVYVQPHHVRPYYAQPVYAEPSYADDEDTQEPTCNWVWTTQRHWNYSHTFRLTTHAKRWVCY